MNESEGKIARRDGTNPPSAAGETPYHQLDLDVPSLSTALQSTPEERLDRHLGRGIAFPLGQERKAQLELYPQVVRVSLPDAQLALRRAEPAVSPEGVVFEQPDRFLSVGADGAVLFQFFPPARSGESKPAAPEVAVSTPPLMPDPAREERSEPATPQAPSPTPEAKEKTKSERYVGRLGEIRTHWTKAGKLVAEVEVMVPDPEQPGASRLVKFAAFNRMAEALRDSYQPGQLVTAVGIPHELKRKGRDGREWSERQLYFVQLPKPR